MTFKTAKGLARRKGWDVIGYDFTDNTWFVQMKGQPEGHFEGSQFIAHECFYFPAFWNASRILRKAEGEGLDISEMDFD